MQENEFEKKVRGIMGGFKVPPSESVWHEVEQRIPKQSRRRRWIAFLLMFTGLIVCGYFFYAKWYNSNPHQKELTAIKEKNNTETNHENNKPVTDTTLSFQQPGLLKEPQQQKDIITSGKKHYTTRAIPQKNRSQPFEKIILNSDKKGRITYRFTDTATTLINKFLSDTISVRTYNSLTDEYNAVTVIKEDTTVKENRFVESKPTVTPIDTKQPDAIKKQLLPVARQTKKEPAKINFNKKWQFGITSFYGRSDVTENLLGLGLDLNKSESADYLTTPGSVAGGTAYNFNVSKQVKAKGTFSLGIDFKKPLSPKASFMIGIQYSNLQTRVETGAIKDSAASFMYNNIGSITSLNSFYRPGSGNPYTNVYHVLQIPVIYERRINHSNKIFINWNGGFSLAQLLSSNALVFDTYHQAFYNNNDLLRKTQLHLLAGINMQFTLNKKVTTNAGPQFQYSLSNLLARDTYGKQHFLSWGLKTSIFLKK